jgi:hypothetical protein
MQPYLLANHPLIIIIIIIIIIIVVATGRPAMLLLAISFVQLLLLRRHSANASPGFAITLHYHPPAECVILMAVYYSLCGLYICFLGFGLGRWLIMVSRNSLRGI